MFKKDEQTQEVETIIGPSVHVEGDFTAAGNVIVEGTVSGNLKTENFLKVGNNAKITAHVTAGNASISGEIHGNITVKEKLELASTAKIFGDIKTKSIQVELGAIMNGKCAVGDDHALKQEDKSSKPIKIKEWKMAEESIKNRL